MENILPKFKFKGKALVLHVPDTLKPHFQDFGCEISSHLNKPSANTLIFINNLVEFLSFLDTELRYIEHDSVLWFAYPKGTSGIKTDINRDILWEEAQAYGIRPVSAIAIDKTWSGLRFRPVQKN